MDNCDKALSAGFKVANELIYDVFDIAPITKLQENLIASLNKKKIKFDTDEKYYALVIGNNNYQYLEKLDVAENDAVVISDVLEKKYGFEVDLLLNADYDQTVNSLFKITDKLKEMIICLFTMVMENWIKLKIEVIGFQLMQGEMRSNG